MIQLYLLKARTIWVKSCNLDQKVASRSVEPFLKILFPHMISFLNMESWQKKQNYEQQKILIKKVPWETEKL